ncbi:TrkH family potassium uptake protein [Candidatus Soleaferrea massiliensis]|uniref:TrkH family potassium uptake protein n=1 Tax=Candidatus Soleaferrea massiliensis TaxID=1470354 RepID=UPI000590331D|nr:potassium transporter TrkG [Candidatus Soleaferrea massiliensis]
MQPNEIKRSSFFSFPTRVIAVSFFCVIITGTILLMLPVSSRDGQMTGFIDCLFTSTSATCVTGLIVFDTYIKWSLFGQTVILILIQIGGLGLVTLTTFFNVIVGRKLGLRGLKLAQETVNHISLIDVTKMVRIVVWLSLIVEFAGSLLLSTHFVPKYGADGVFISIFLAVSSFCNAGFDILGREGAFSSLTNYQGEPLVLITIAALIVIGGLGFIVWYDLMNYRKTKRLMLHTKVVLIMTIGLIVFGFLGFLLFEWNNPETLGSLPTEQRFLGAFFQSITMRTAGFNSIDMNAMHGITKFMSIGLMFIGAAPGSTGGGIKVTTFAVILMTVFCVARGKEDTTITRKCIDKHVVYKSLAITCIALFAVGIAAMTIFFTTDSPLVSGINSLFEAVSAFATVGVSVGISGVASVLSKVILIITMFIGRVGPVSLALFFTMRRSRNKKSVMPQGKIIVG